MSFRLPPAGSFAREAMGDIEHVAEVLDPRNIDKLPTFRAALSIAKKQLQNSAGAKRINIICIRADDERWLLSVGPRGGYRCLWNFGTGAQS